LKRDPKAMSIARRRAERELLFWTIRQTCFAALLTAATICAVISLFADEFDSAHLVEQLLRRAAALFLSG
jgi:hypothetical protein